MWRLTDSGPIWGRWTWELDCAVEEAPHLVVDGKERWGRDQGLGTAFKVCPCRDQLLPTSFPSFVPPALKRASHLKSIQPMNLWLTSSNQTIPQSLTIWSRIAIARMGCSEEEIWRWANRKQSRNLGLHREEGAKTKSPPKYSVFLLWSEPRNTDFILAEFYWCCLLLYIVWKWARDERDWHSLNVIGISHSCKLS